MSRYTQCYRDAFYKVGYQSYYRSPALFPLKVLNILELRYKDRIILGFILDSGISPLMIPQDIYDLIYKSIHMDINDYIKDIIIPEQNPNGQQNSCIRPWGCNLHRDTEKEWKQTTILDIINQ